MEAKRLRAFLVGWRARLALAQLRRELSGIDDDSALPPDEAIERFVSHHTQLLGILARLHHEPALKGLAPLAAKSLQNVDSAKAFTEGLSLSPQRADAMYPKPSQDPDALLVEVRAAELLGVSTRTLQAWRSQGCGPPFVRVGRAIRYRRRDLLSWIQNNTIHPQAVSRLPATPTATPHHG